MSRVDLCGIWGAPVEIGSVGVGHSDSLDSEAGTRRRRKRLLRIRTLPPVVLM